MMGDAGILMALYHRDRTGEGQFVECPQLGLATLGAAEVVIRADGSIEDQILPDDVSFGHGWRTMS